jgi:hypothetical protein
MGVKWRSGGKSGSFIFECVTTIGVALLVLGAWSPSSLGQSYCCSHAAKVRQVQVAGSRSGVTAWTAIDSSVFPNCTANPTVMFIETDTSIVTEASARSMLAVLLTAKATDQTVTAYYAVDANGNCRMRHVVIN